MLMADSSIDSEVLRKNSAMLSVLATAFPVNEQSTGATWKVPIACVRRRLCMTADISFPSHQLDRREPNVSHWQVRDSISAGAAAHRLLTPVRLALQDAMLQYEEMTDEKPSPPRLSTHQYPQVASMLQSSSWSNRCHLVRGHEDAQDTSSTESFLNQQFNIASRNLEIRSADAMRADHAAAPDASRYRTRSVG